MSELEILNQDYVISLGTFFGSAILFFSLFYGLLARFEYLATRSDYKRPWVELYSTWPMHKKADLSFRICGQVHAAVSVGLATKAVFFSW